MITKGRGDTRPCLWTSGGLSKSGLPLLVKFKFTFKVKFKFKVKVKVKFKFKVELADGEFHYAMSILKSNNGNPKSNNRYTYTYENPIAGEGRFIHTYMHDGNPLPSFEGEPKWISIPDDMDAFTDALWNSLNEENKVSLFVRYIDIATGTYETKIINKNK